MPYHQDSKTVQAATTTLAFLTCFARRRRPFMFNGVWWSFCAHRSHRVGARCWRWFVYDGYCHKHNGSCYGGCKTHGT